jgi:signal transduction histidine kinase
VGNSLDASGGLMSGTVGYLSLILDAGLLIVGAWAMFKGSLPARLLSILIGMGDYRTDGRSARLFGLLLVVPFAVFTLAVFLIVTTSEQSAILVSVIQITVLILVILTAVRWARQIRSRNKASE